MFHDLLMLLRWTMCTSRVASTMFFSFPIVYLCQGCDGSRDSRDILSIQNYNKLVSVMSLIHLMMSLEKNVLIQLCVNLGCIQYWPPSRACIYRGIYRKPRNYECNEYLSPYLYMCKLNMARDPQTEVSIKIHFSLADFPQFAQQSWNCNLVSSILFHMHFEY
jgi:hypothetical protein